MSFNEGTVRHNLQRAAAIAFFGRPGLASLEEGSGNFGNLYTSRHSAPFQRCLDASELNELRYYLLGALAGTEERFYIEKALKRVIANDNDTTVAGG